jgi:hypothetical protein
MVYALLDGAGTDGHSQVAVDLLAKDDERILHESLVERSLFLGAGVVNLATSVNNLNTRSASAGMVMHIDPRILSPYIGIVGYGDITAIGWLPAEDFLGVLAHDPETLIDSRPSQAGFFGAEKRHPYEVARKLVERNGWLPLTTVPPKDRRFTVVAVSDGVSDDRGRGVSTEKICDIIGSSPDRGAKNVAKLIMKELELQTPYDDAAVLVVRGSETTF